MTIEMSAGLSGWLTQTLLPGWLARLHDPARPGFVEVTDADGTPSGGDAATTLGTARLIHVFSHAHLLGVPGALAAARHGLDFLWTVCRRPDGRFCHRCTRSGDVLDARSDFYDLAFVLFALGWFGRATGESLAFERAREVMGFVEGELAHPEGGFREDTLGTLPRRQNPHMHLLEACHVLGEASGEVGWLVRADALVALMRRRMLDGDGAIAEFFDEDWQAWPGPAGLVREPGHQFEWIWLLHHHDRLTGSPSARDTARRLYKLASGRHGGAAGAARPVVNALDPEGQVLDGEALLWPQTEYLKALAARVEFERDDEALGLMEAHLDLLFARFVDRATGLWTNRLDVSGAAVEGPIPVRVLYHLLLACAEVARVRQLVTTRAAAAVAASAGLASFEG